VFDVFLVGDLGKNTLLDLSFQQHQHAEHEVSGSGSDKHGRNGKDLHIRVPLGTVVKDIETGEIILEVVETKEYLLFPGGRGGRGNARFKTSTNRAPEYHQPEIRHHLFRRLLHPVLHAEYIFPSGMPYSPPRRFRNAHVFLLNQQIS
jgi:GTPase involved in cell partitioning and DNA repair